MSEGNIFRHFPEVLFLAPILSGAASVRSLQVRLCRALSEPAVPSAAAPSSWRAFWQPLPSMVPLQLGAAPLAAAPAPPAASGPLAGSDQPRVALKLARLLLFFLPRQEHWRRWKKGID